MKKIALSPGDPAGIGPEICLKSLKEINNPKDFVLIGDIDFYKKLSKDLNLNLSFEETLDAKDSILVKNIKLNSKVDESLIGGIVLQIGSLMIDTSIKNKLLNYKKY